MTQKLTPGMIWLQLRLAFARIGLIPCIAALTMIAGAAAWLWLVPHARVRNAEQRQVQAQLDARLRSGEISPSFAKPTTAEKNLENFYDALGERRYSEQQVKSLFDIAQRTGLSLNQAEYKTAFDRNSRTYTYQILLPVKGPYRAIRQFCEKTLRAIPFSSLDEMDFKRETIGSNTLEAKLRFTLYLTESTRPKHEASD